MKWNIIGDSSCDLFELETPCEEITYRSVPFVLNIEDKEFKDDEGLNTAEMVKFMKSSKKASSSACPSPEAWQEKMVEGENNICVTISKNLSGSYQSADIAVKNICEEFPETKAAVVDGWATGPSSVLTVRKLVENIKKGEDFDSVIKNTEEYVKGIHTVFALSCFDNLVKAGRVGKIAGILAASLGFWGVGIEKGGRIAFRAKIRGKKKAIAEMLAVIKENGFNGGDVVISHCLNEELALKMKEEIEALDSSVNVTILPTRGLNSYYADNEGIIISY
ncbi:MAG: DegV family EDD domain-containing protein [Ruminococcaceae bacterium]|nr:DegV family EDD domain-containing protein [Oscillospiraceae bacterium]